VTEELEARAEEYLRVPDGRRVAPPTAEKRDRLMKRVMRLNVEVAKLEQERGGRDRCVAQSG
jgi:hypothetical protein